MASQEQLEQFGLGLAYNAATAEISGEKSYKWSNRLAYQNHLRQLDYFDHTFATQSAYSERVSDPAYQLSRARAAGVNPYASSQLSGGSTPAAAQGATSASGPALGAAGAGLPPGVSQLSDASAVQARSAAALTRAQTMSSEDYHARFAEELSSIGLQNEGQRLSNSLKAVDFSYAALIKDSQLGLTAAQIDSFESSTKQALAETMQTYLESGREPLVRAKLLREYEQLAVQMALARAMASASNADARLKLASISEVYARTRNLKETLDTLKLESKVARGIMNSPKFNKYVDASFQRVYYAGLSAFENYRADKYNSDRSELSLGQHASTFGQFWDQFGIATDALGNVFSLSAGSHYSRSQSSVETRHRGKTFSTDYYEDSTGKASTRSTTTLNQ